MPHEQCPGRNMLKTAGAQSGYNEGIIFPHLAIDGASASFQKPAHTKLDDGLCQFGMFRMDDKRELVRRRSVTPADTQPGPQSNAGIVHVVLIAPRKKRWQRTQRTGVELRKFFTLLQHLRHLYPLRGCGAIKLVQSPHMVAIPAS